MNRFPIHIMAVPLAERLLSAQRVLQADMPLRRDVDRSPAAMFAAVLRMRSAHALLKFTTAANDDSAAPGAA